MTLHQIIDKLCDCAIQSACQSELERYEVQKQRAQLHALVDHCAHLAYLLKEAA